ncbi:MAG: hypothetical protein P4L69_16865 [Desulfosporosinus sp.]|nr:hypothetical protein [Desulfosporosinus sp.]
MKRKGSISTEPDQKGQKKVKTYPASQENPVMNPFAVEDDYSYNQEAGEVGEKLSPAEGI